MAKSHFEKALQYVRDNKTWTEAEEQVALNDMDRWRCPLTHTQTGERIADQINDLMEEYGEDNDLPEGWWLDEVSDAEDIFWKL